MQASWREGLKSAIAGLILAAAISSAHAQAVPCTGPTQGNCVAVVPFSSALATPAGSGNAGYPAGATPVANSATGTTGAVVATLPASATKITYLCGFYATGSAATPDIVNVIVANVVGGPLTFPITHPTSPALGVASPPPFTDCLPTTAVNTSITVTSAADATATNASVAAWGFQQ